MMLYNESYSVSSIHLHILLSLQKTPLFSMNEQYLFITAISCYKHTYITIDKIGVIHDPLGQPSKTVSVFTALDLKIWDGQTTCVNIVITTGRGGSKSKNS